MVQPLRLCTAPHRTAPVPQVDRLITELKLPPADAYHKLRHTIEDINALIVTYSGGWAGGAAAPRRDGRMRATPQPSPVTCHLCGKGKGEEVVHWVCLACACGAGLVGTGEVSAAAVARSPVGRTALPTPLTHPATATACPPHRTPPPPRCGFPALWLWRR